MSVVIVGGNECMECHYRKLCKKYKCRAKIYTKMNGTLRNKIGSPDLLVLFTSTVSHKMVQCAVNEIKGLDTVVERSHSSSMEALEKILNKFISQEDVLCQSN